MTFHSITTRRLAVLGAAVGLSLAACDDGASDPAEPLDQFSEAELTAAKTTYADVVLATYTDALTTAESLQSAIDAFVAAPSEAGLEACKTAWLAAREPYGQTEAFRFYDGPIDNADTGPEGQLNAWPMDESYVDYVEGDPDAGIINRPTDFPELTASELAAANEAGGTDETAVSTGYHAIEFLLWGQDMSDEGPGTRPWQDYLPDGDAEATAPNGERRGAYLKTVAALLVSDLQTLVDAWDTGGANYREAFVALDTEEALRRILTGMGILSNGELAGERMDVAMETKAQEDEHSCFSDNTHRDIVNNAKGIENVWNGTYGTVTGTSPKTLLQAVDADLAAKLTGELRASVEAAEAIPEPFDQAIKDDAGRAAVQATIDALRAQAVTIVKAAEALGVGNLSTNIPE